MHTHAQTTTTCPIIYTLGIIGDQWTLVIARNITFYGQHTYSEFLDSGEGITTSMLADTLAFLEAQGLLSKHRDPRDGRREIYNLTPKGLDLFIPVLVDMADWGVKHNAHTTPKEAWVRQAKADKNVLIRLIRNTVQAGGSVFRGANSVLDQLQAAVRP